jgi:hypothetical protein
MPIRQSYAPRARFTVLASRRMGLDCSEFDVQLCEGNLEPFDLFNFEERGTVWEYVILAIKKSHLITPYPA